MSNLKNGMKNNVMLNRITVLDMIQNMNDILIQKSYKHTLNHKMKAHCPTSEYDLVMIPSKGARTVYLLSFSSSDFMDKYLDNIDLDII